MKEALQYHSEKELSRFSERGVIIPDPATVCIERSLQPDRIAPGTVLYPFSRIEGDRSRIDADAQMGIYGPASVSNSVIGKGVKLGTLGAVTLKDTVVGPFSVLGSGSAEETVFLGKETKVNDFTAGFGFRTRRGSLYEEDTSSGQHTDTKMTLLMPWVTLGSNINFCDALVSGGTGPELGSFSEIGSGSIHFNFTPSGDKATASLFGNVVEGVFLNQERLFIGGNNSLIGPLEAQFGAYTAAGIRIHGKLTSGLHTGKVLSRRVIIRDFRILGQVYRTLSTQFNYFGELCALLNWYREIRIGVMADDPPTRELYEAGFRIVQLNMKERISQLHNYFRLLDQSIGLLRGKKETCKELERQRMIASYWPKLEDSLQVAMKLEIPGPDEMKNELSNSTASRQTNYTRRIQGLTRETTLKGVDWLTECREKVGRLLMKLITLD